MSAGRTPEVFDASSNGAQTILVRYFASARAATGIDEEKVELPAGASVATAVDQLAALHPERLPTILRAASFLCNGVVVRDATMPLPAGGQLDVLPPFAGG